MKNLPPLILWLLCQHSAINLTAQISKPPDTPLVATIREGYIQQATELRKAEDYIGAARQLDTILMHNTSDAPILLFQGDLLLQGRQFAKAAAAYKALLSLNYEPTISRINLSYALFMNHKSAKALGYAQQAWKEDKKHNGAVVNHFNAMLWNSKTKQAAEYLIAEDSLLTPAQRLVLQARLFTTSGNYMQGLKLYDSLVKNYPDKYYVQEYAEVLLGKKETQQSVAVMKSGENLFSAAEYKAYQLKVKATQLQNAGTEFVYFKDVAKNIRIENSVWWQQREGEVYRFRLSAGTSSITSAQKEKTNAQFIHVVINERWNKQWSGETDLHLQLIQPSGGANFTGLTGRQSVQYQPNDRRMVGAFVSADILNFTASLLQKNIRSTNAGYITHIMFSGKTGFYSQGSAGILSDKNQRFLIFSSLYRLFRTEPTLKAGLNFSALHFKDSSIKTYFSPNKYLNTELFADYTTALPLLAKFYLQLQAAAGLQKIEKQAWETAFRMQAEIGFRLQHLESSVKYQTSNVAAGTGTGYKFNWFTLRVAWKW
jgi:tetratricopeptide (TPR) repeat protein